jgi:hypothetical protein
MMSVEQSVEWLEGETEVLGENLPQCRSVHYKSHTTGPGLQPGNQFNACINKSLVKQRDILLISLLPYYSEKVIRNIAVEI